MKWIKFFLFVFSLNLFLACNQQKSMDELIEIEVQAKIDKLKKEKIEDCWVYISKQAEMHVDSIMYLEIGSALNDSMVVPDRPIRNDDSVSYEITLDSTGIDEHWRDTLNK